MNESRGKYFRFWANNDNSVYLDSLEKGTKGTVINEALRLYADTSKIATPVMNTMRASSLSAAGFPAVMAVSASPPTSNTFPAPNRLVCPLGHLWLNGTERCVNSKCQYGKAS